MLYTPRAQEVEAGEYEAQDHPYYLVSLSPARAVHLRKKKRIFIVFSVFVCTWVSLFDRSGSAAALPDHLEKKGGLHK